MTNQDQNKEFEKQANQKSAGLLSEFTAFLRENKAWWLIPIVAALLLLGVIIILGGTGAAPFIYALF